MIYYSDYYEMLVLKANHDVIKNKVSFVNFYFIFDECLDEFLGEFST